MANLAPIAIFVYNRADHLKQCIYSLQQNTLASKSDLYVFSDGPKNTKDIKKVLEVREFLKKINGFKKISLIFKDENHGLANSIIDGVSMVLENYNEIIVIEDDLILSNDFIEYMNNALKYYNVNDKVFSISAYCAPINITDYNDDTFFYQRINSWGWGTWKNRWDSVDWELSDFDAFISSPEKRHAFNRGGKDLSMMLLKYKLGIIDSWAIRFNYACFKQNKLNLYPVKSKIVNLGVDNSGTNTKKSSKFNTIINNESVNFIESVKANDKITKAYSRYLSSSLFRQIINWYKINKYNKKRPLNKQTT